MPYAGNSTTENYQYQPLDHTTRQIRLVTLLDLLENDDAIRLDIKVFEISEAPLYTALSYVWGPSPSKTAVEISNGKLEIRENLFKFLTEFRKRSDKTPSDQYLWIDQLCIDQSTTSERNHQVQMMSDIYSKATSVIAWLGDGSQKADPSTGIAGRECDKFENMYDAACVWRDAKEPAAFAYILHTKYFTRLWIIQEFILAAQIRILVRDVWLVDDKREWESRAESLVDYLHHSVSRTAYNIICKSSLRRAGEFKHLDICAILDRYLTNGCADPRDKVYGLLGLVRLDQRITVDYVKSTDQIFMEVALVTFRSRCLKNLAEQEARYDSSKALLYGAAYAMNITPSRWKGFLGWFSNIEHSSKLGRFHGHACPITAMGLEKAEKTSSSEEDQFWFENTSSREVDQFWFDFQGKRHFIHRTRSGAAELTDETKELLTGDWAKYVPQEHGDETSSLCVQGHFAKVSRAHP